MIVSKQRSVAKPTRSSEAHTMSYGKAFLALCGIVLGCNMASGDPKGNVISESTFDSDEQVMFPWRKQEKVKKEPANLDLLSPSGEVVIKVQCEVYEKRNSRIMIYTHDGVLIDFAFLAPSNYDPCLQSNIKNIISPKNPINVGDNKKKISIHYTHRIKVQFPKRERSLFCVEREYTIDLYDLVAEVNRSQLQSAKCSTEVDEFLRLYPDEVNAGGIGEFNRVQVLSSRGQETGAGLIETDPQVNANKKSPQPSCLV